MYNRHELSPPINLVALLCHENKYFLNSSEFSLTALNLENFWQSIPLPPSLIKGRGSAGQREAMPLSKISSLSPYEGERDKGRGVGKQQKT